MKMVRKYFLIFLNFGVFAQSNQTVSIVNNYNDWGWNKVFVTKNKYISVAVVPDAAGRILEYNLGDVPSLWVNPKLYGKVFKPNDSVKMNEWRNFGGYRLVPIPVDNFAVNNQGEKTKRWPPPAVMGDSPYEVAISTNAKGYQTIHARSGVQNLPVPVYDNASQSFSNPKQIDEQLQYSRTIYIEEDKSLVFIKHTLKNSGKRVVERGLKITSQHPSRSKPELEDGENFLAYIPFDENLKLSNEKPFEITATPEARWNFINRNRFPLDKNNPEHVAKYFNHGTNWKGEVVPGVYELHYDYNLMGGFHIISSKSWICYVNKLENTAFVKLFEPYNKDLNYEFGANAEIYNSGLETGYLETEIKTPIYILQPNESFEYFEIQAAATIASTPILDVNKTGIITKRLNLNVSKNELAGEYGVFIEGEAFLQFKNKTNQILKEIDLAAVNPLQAFTFNIAFEWQQDIVMMELLIKDKNNQLHLLDSYTKTKH